MAKTRLNREMRERLLAFASAKAVSPTHDKTKEKAYAAALPLVLTAVLKKYPETDMAILAKYDLAAPDACLIGYSDVGQQVKVTLREADAPVCPKGYCRSRNYVWPAKCVAAIEEFNLRSEQAEDERRRIVRDYKSLIENYQTAEDIIEAWPAAQTVLQGFLNAANRSLPATLPLEALERIKALNVGAGTQIDA